MASALDVIQVVVEAALFGQKVLNVWHAIAADAVSDGDILDDMQVRIEDMYTPLLTYLADDLVYQQMQVRNLTDPTDYGIVDLSSLGNGSATADPLPSNVAGLVTLPTSKPGTRGRKYLAGLTETATVGGLLDSTTVTALTNFGVAAAAGFLGNSSGAPWVWCVVDSLLQPHPFTGALITNVLATMGRRKIGVGA